MIKRMLGLLVLCIASAPAFAQAYSNNVVIILDGSASMGEPMENKSVTKMAAAKEALKTVLAQLPPNTNVGLLVFSAKNKQGMWVCELGPVQSNKLNKGIDFVIADGGTPLGEYIKIGADKLLEQRAKQFGYGSYRLLVVTDGEASDPELMEQFAPEVVQRGITLDVIGVDMQRDHTLSQMANFYRRADDPATLTKALQSVFAEVSTTDTADASGEDFALLAAIPVEVAGGMLEALATQTNQPIGEKPQSKQARAQDTPAQQATTPTPVSAAPAPAPTPQQDSESSGIPPWAAALLIVGAIAVVFGKRRKRR